MRMRETPRSLSIYFVVVGIFGVLVFIGELTRLEQAERNLFVILFLLSGIGFSCAFLYFGFSLKSNLVNSPRRVTRVLFANMVYLGVFIALSLFAGGVAEAIKFSFGLLVTWYLIRNVRRLSSELAAEKTVA